MKGSDKFANFYDEKYRNMTVKQLKQETIDRGFGLKNLRDYKREELENLLWRDDRRLALFPGIGEDPNKVVRKIEKTHMSKNKEILDSFVQYCNENPELRFWQALRNWSGFNFIGANNSSFEEDVFDNGWVDTFYWENKRGNNDR